MNGRYSSSGREGCAEGLTPDVTERWAHQLRNALSTIEGSAEIIQLMATGGPLESPETEAIIDTAGEIRAASRKVEEVARELKRNATQRRGEE